MDTFHGDVVPALDLPGEEAIVADLEVEVDSEIVAVTKNEEIWETAILEPVLNLKTVAV